MKDTRERMLGAALELFHRQGVKGTSVDQVLEKSGTGKSQFTHYFKTKEGLVHATLGYLHEIIRSGRVSSNYNIRTWDDMEAWFGRYIQFQMSVACELSCPLGTIANDITNDQELLRQDVRLFLEWCHGQLSRFFAERKAAGEMVEAADPDGLADFCMAIMEGGMLLTKMDRNPRSFQRAADQALAYIRSLRKPTSAR
jgi:TetR/AcrR family transcriptional regulator, transcriptional repressor for nem operon